MWGPRKLDGCSLNIRVGAPVLSAELLFNFQGAAWLTQAGTASGLLICDVLPSSYIHIIVSVSKKINCFLQILPDFAVKKSIIFPVRFYLFYHFVLYSSNTLMQYYYVTLLQ